MSRNFPHLQKANTWPGIDTVDPFDLEVTFDPYLWTPDVTIHLCATPLDMAYRNVGGWPSQADRDAWFDAISDRELTVDSEMHILPGVEIKLPYAFEVLNEYNQIFIDFPPTPTEGGNETPRRYYYFLSDIQYRSPSSTACVISIDEWTTHMYDVDMRYIELARGHAPMAAITPEDYLKDPIHRCELLTVPDENAGGAPSRIQHSAAEIINQGPMWAVIVMSADVGQSPGTWGGADWRTPTTHSWGTQGVASYVQVAVETAELSGFLDALENNAPQIFATIMACFLIPKKLVNVVGELSYLGYTVRGLDSKQYVSDIVTLTPPMFGYPTEYAGIAKLYTSPYAAIDIVDSDGRSQTIRVEDTTGRLKLSTVASIVYPMVGYDVYVMGIGTAATSTLQWNNFASRDLEAAGDWSRTLRQFKIPTYAVIQNPEQRFNYTQWWPRTQRGAAIDESLRQAKLGASTQLSLTNAGLDRTTARMGEKHQQQREALQLSLTATSQTRAQQRARVLGDMGDDATMSNKAFAAGQEQTYLAQSQAQARAELAEKRDTITTVAALAAATVAGGALIGTVGGAVAGGATTIAAMTTPAAGASLMGFAGSVYQVVQDGMHLDGTMLQASQEQASLMLAATNNEELNRWASGQYYMSKRDRMTRTQDAMYAIADQLQRDGLSNQISWESTITGRDVALSRTQAATQKSLADNCAEGSAALNRLSLELEARAGRIGTPGILATVGGDARSVTSPTAVTIQIRTQDAGAIATAGDQFLRYGYRMGGRQWRITSLTPMSSFTYWEGRVQLGAGAVNGVTREVISSIFAAGTTVWRDPSKIGSTSIYENRRTTS